MLDPRRWMKWIVVVGPGSSLMVGVGVMEVEEAVWVVGGGWWGGWGGEADRDGWVRDRQTERQRQTDRQRDRETDSEKQTHRQTDGRRGLSLIHI